MTDQQKLKAVRNMAFIAGFLLGIVFATIMHSVNGYKKVEAQQPAFDHSNCQYPDRWTNPADGCDNSDPAVPECIKSFNTKANEDACIAAFVAQQNPQPVQPVTPTVTPAPTQAAQCGGK